MIKSEIHGDIFTTKDKHIVFALNTEGCNDSGFAGIVSKNYFPEIINTGGNTLGDVLSKEVNGKTFHGIVCHSLREGWDNADQIILDALNKLQLEDEISIIAIGTGLIGRLSGAPTSKICDAFESCNKQLNCYMF